MQLSAPPAPRRDAPDIAAALQEAATTLGHRPAVTVLSPRGREEQGVASLAQWAAKGAHLLELDLLLGPGDRLRLDAPLSWTSAAVCLAAWWAGVTVTLDGDAPVAVVHESRPRPDGCDDLLRLGDAIDGAPLTEVAGEPWVHAVQTFPDQPPAPRAAPDAAALERGDVRWSQGDLLVRAGNDQDRTAEGTCGVHADTIDAVDGLIAVALRPLVVGRPTVVLQQVDRAAASGERVTRWY